MERTEFDKKRLGEDLDAAVDKTARAQMELWNASPEARRCASHTLWIGPCDLVFRCEEDELRSLFFALKRLEGSGIEPTAESIAREAVALGPRDVLVGLRRIPSGELAELRDRGAIDPEDPFGVRVRGEDASEAERTLAWLLVQAGLPSAAAEALEPAA